MSDTLTIASTAPFPTCPARLSPEQIEQFHREGYLAFADVLSPAEVEGVRQAMVDMLEELRLSHRAQSSSYGSVWRQQEGRMAAQFELGKEPTSVDDPDLDIKVRKFVDFVDANEHLSFVARGQERIQGILQDLIGADPIMAQNQALVKPPFFGSEKPWHQDDAYFNYSPLESVCGVWIAIDDATPENGCMHVMPGTHKLGPLRHYHGTDCELTPERFADALANTEAIVPIPLAPGGALFFSGILPHQTPPNRTADRRRALQFHYRSKDSVVLKSEEYDKVFVEADGTAATCAAASRRGL